jgi:esterase/lipase
MKLKKILRYLATIVLIVLMIVAVGLAWLWVKPLNTEGLKSSSAPAKTYEEALAKIKAVQALDTADINPICNTQLMTHGSKTDKVIVFLHGYTNCPHQFVKLGQQFFDAGYNVYIPRMPRMGYADRLDPRQGDLTAEEMVAWSDNTADIADGLGSEVTVVGLSGGATAAAWLAQFRSDIKSAVIIAPVFGIKDVPAWLNRPFTSLVLTMPNTFFWWDSELKENAPGPVYGYPRFATRPSGELIRLGYAVEYAAQQTKPAAGSILVVTNPNDKAINVDRLNTIVALWNKTTKVDTYQFDASVIAIHDIIDENQKEQNTAVVYPILFKLITER